MVALSMPPNPPGLGLIPARLLLDAGAGECIGLYPTFSSVPSTSSETLTRVCWDATASFCPYLDLLYDVIHMFPPRSSADWVRMGWRLQRAKVPTMYFWP
ncbi:hypothetical protein KC320_g237 [Hortaea werneckii]|nr:hypothetical protein KC320_g237 [Hortaea werneckii]